MFRVAPVRETLSYVVFFKRKASGFSSDDRMVTMKKNVGLLIALILLGQLFPLLFCASEARADTRVTITFAAGGVACGAYIFLQFAFRSSMTPRPFRDHAALFNHGPEGWYIEAPTLNVLKDDYSRRLSFTDPSETLQMNILNLRF
jgi:hypothetical protein